MQPIDYTIDVPTPMAQGFAGLQTGIGLQQAMLKREALQRQALYEQQMQADLTKLATNPQATAADYSGMMAKYPKLSEGLKRGWDTLERGQQQTKLGTATQVYAAINSGRNEIAIQLLKDQAEAYRNSGREDDAKAAETMAEFIKLDPASAKTTAGLLLSSVMGPEKFAETLTKIGSERRADEVQPLELKKREIELPKLTAEAKKAEADAETAAVKARFAESQAVKDLEMAGWNIKKIQADINIARENARIAAMNAAIGREGNAIKREELQLRRDEALQKRDEKVREKVGEAESARFNIDNFLNTADRILATPKDVVGAAAGPISSRIPTTSQATADFEALVENFDAQAFLSQIPNLKGMGALSNAEGLKVSAALQNLSLKQSPERLLENVREAQRLMIKARQNLAQKLGIPDTVPDTPAARAPASRPGAAPGAKSTDDILRELGVMK